MSGKDTNGKVRCNPKSSIDLLKYGILHIPTTLKIILADNRRDPKNSDRLSEAAWEISQPHAISVS